MTPTAQDRAAAPASALANMSPAYFGLVMATGIISLAGEMLGYGLFARVLFGLNVVQYIVLVVLYALRAIRHPRRFFGDMVNHATGPGYFTAIAGTGIVASQFMILREDFIIGALLWGVTTVLWLILTYTIFAALTIRHDKPPFESGISGAWLLAVVATQAVSVTSALLAPQLGQPLRLELNFLALSTWLFGGMLYIWMMALIFYRYTFFRFSPSDLSPPYWINMGAMAISTLAGSLLVLEAPHAPYLTSLLPFIKGFTLFYWATGTWWIPMLLVLGVWRHVYERFPLRYDPLYWGAVFPLGMYTACTWQLDQAMEFDFLQGFSRWFFLLAIAAWALAFFGLLLSLWQGFRRHQARQAGATPH